MSARRSRRALDGQCSVIAQARLRGDQPVKVRGIAAVGASIGSACETPHVAIRVAGVLIYFEDRDALESVKRALRQADALADRVFGI